MIQLRHITKRFGPLRAVDDVSLQIPPSTVLALLGENGAGKSTLVHLLFGILKPDTGEVLAGERRIRSPRDAAAAGIGIVHQHFKLVPTLTALQNMALFVRRSARRLRPAAMEWLARLRWAVPLDSPVAELTVGQQQRVEIVKALLIIDEAAARGAERDVARSPTLVLDEPTAVLTPQETAELFTALRAVRDAGTAVVFISHKLDEVRRICDRIAILRRGVLIYTGPLGDMTAEAIAEKMVGTRIEMPHLVRAGAMTPTNPLPPEKTHTPTAATPLAFHNVSAGQLKSISLDLHPHEILGIAGVDGNGQSQLVQTILGTRRIDAGSIILGGNDVAGRSTRRRLDQIAFIAEDRQREALVLPLSIQENLMLKAYRERPYSHWGWLRFGRWRAHARKLVAECDIRAASPREITGRLSGGNQQKVVIARELFSGDKPLVLAVNPTRGLDVGATAFVLRQLLAARQRGAGILLIHPDLDELLSVSDRVAVLYNGTLTPTRWPETTRDAIGRMMLGLRDAEAA